MSGSQYEHRLIRRLRNPRNAMAYLMEALTHGGKPGLRLALRELIRAHGVVQTGNLLRKGRSMLKHHRRTRVVNCE
jgi:hypothetical protein